MLPGKVYTPGVVFEALWRHRWVIVIPFVLCSAGMAFYSQSLPNRWRSEIRILIVPQRIPESYVRSTVTTRIEDRLRSIKDQILSRSRLEPVILEFNLYPEQRARMSMEEVVEIMRPQVTVETVRSDSFRIGYVSRDSMTPVRVVTKLATMFIEEDQRDRAVMAEDTNAFLESQLADAKTRLIEHEQKLESFRTRYSGQLPSQFQSNLQMIQATQNQMQAMADAINRDRDRRLLLEKSLSEAQATEPGARSTLPGESAAAGPISTVDQLEAARLELAALEQRLKPTHPDIVAKRKQVAALETQLASQNAPTTDAKPVAARSTNSSETLRQSRIAQIQGEITKLDAQTALKEKEQRRLQTVVDEYQKRVEAVPARETDMTELMRDYDTLQRIYTSLLAKKEDSNISANLERKQVGEQFKILDPARPAEVPFSPNRLRMNVIGSILGLFLGLAFAGVMEYRDTSLREEDDIVRIFSLPVIAVVPFMESPRERRGRRLRLAFSGVVGAAGLVALGLAIASRYNLVPWLP